MDAPPTSPLRSVIRHVGAIAAAIGFGWLGLAAGSALAYAIAAWTDRDVAELKDMLIWSSVAGGVACAIAGIWLVLLLTRASREARRVALIAAGSAIVLGGLLMLGSFDWPKGSGAPVVQYELRLPAGMSLPDRSKIGLTVWSDRGGQGCYVDKVRLAERRPEVAGNCVLNVNNLNPTLSLRLSRETEGHWRLPIRPDAALEPAFGPWQRIEFIPSPRAGLPPLPPGAYDIRYRVRKYL